MKTFNYVITDEVGLHARPAGLLVKEAGKYTSNITVESNGKSADSKRIIAIMGLGVKKDDEVTVNIEGSDEDAAFEALQTFFTENL